MSRRGKQQGQPALAPFVESADAVGVTLVSPAYAHLAGPAVERFQRHTGLEVVVIHVPTENAFAAKLNLDVLVAARPIIYFDVDWWMLRRYDDLSKFAWADGWSAVPDPGARKEGIFPQVDCAREGWSPDTYFNSGLFCCNLKSPVIRSVFQTARGKLRRCHAGVDPAPADWTDQYFLNWAVREWKGLFRPLPWSLNFYRHAVANGHATVPRVIHGAHAAGYSLPEKLGALEDLEGLYGER